MASKWQACGRPAAGPGSFVATGAAGSGKRSSPIPTSSWLRRMPCRRCDAPWPPLRKLRPMRRGRHCRICGGQRQSWQTSWKRPGPGRTARPSRLRGRASRRDARTRDSDPADRGSLSERCSGRWRCQAPGLVAILVAVLAAISAADLVAVLAAVSAADLVAGLATILATLLVAVAAVTVTLAVRYSRICAN